MKPRRPIVSTILLAILTMAAIGAVYHQRRWLRAELETQAHANLESTARTFAGVISTWRDGCLREARSLRYSPVLSEELPAFLHEPGGDKDAEQTLMTWMQTVGQEYRYQTVVITSLSGTPLLATRSPSQADARKTVSTLVNRAIERADAVSSELAAPWPGGTVLLDVAVPIPGDGRSEAVLIVTIDASSQFTSFPQIGSQLPVAETLLVSSLGTSLLVRDGGGMSSVRSTAQSDLFASAIRERTTANSGSGELHDFGILMAFSSVPGTRWRVVSLAPRQEIDTQLQSRLRYLDAIGVLLIAMAMLACLFLWRERHTRAYRKMYERERRKCNRLQFAFSRCIHDIGVQSQRMGSRLPQHDSLPELPWLNARPFLRIEVEDLSREASQSGRTAASKLARQLSRRGADVPPSSPCEDTSTQPGDKDDTV